MNSAKAAAKVFQEHRDELGFVNSAQCAEKDLYTVYREGSVVGASLGNHCVRKPQTTLYELAVLPEYRREGIAETLINRMAADSPHEKLVAKCPAELDSNKFYSATGWTRVDRETGKKRPLNVWEYDINTVDVYMTVNNGTETAEAISQSAAFPGVESSNGWPLEESPAFVDWPFTDPDAGLEQHLEAVRETKPKLTTAPDVESGRSLSQVVEIGDKLLEHADACIIVPKDCHPSEIPDRFRVGLTAGRYGSMAPWSVWEYRDAGPVHILGGSPSEQLEISKCVDVASTDSYSLGRRAQFGIWDNGAAHAPDWMDYYDRLTHSLDNFWGAINQ